jgi:hypothetical protein
MVQENKTAFLYDELLALQPAPSNRSKNGPIEIYLEVLLKEKFF